MFRREFLKLGSILPFGFNLSWFKEKKVPSEEVQQIHEVWSKHFKHDDWNLSLILEGQRRINEKEDPHTIEGRCHYWNQQRVRLSIPLIFRVMREFKPKGSYEKLNKFYTFTVDFNYKNWRKTQKFLSQIELDNECEFCAFLQEKILKELKSKFTNKITVSGFYFRNDQITMNYERT